MKIFKKQSLLIKITLTLLIPSFLLASDAAVGDAMCYSNIETEGLCVNSDLFSGGIGCKKTITLKNTSDSKLTKVSVDIVKSPINGSLISDCGIDGHSKFNHEKGKSCKSSSIISFSRFVDIGNEGISYKPMKNFKASQTHTIYYKSAVEASILSQNNLYAKYNIGGKEYEQQIQACSSDVTQTTHAKITTDQRPFTLRISKNIHGNLAVIGNTVLCWKDGGNTCKASDKENNNLSLSYVNTNNYHGTYPNSSTANINIPSNATVVWAGLYTQGDLNINSTGAQQSIVNAPTHILHGDINITASPSNIDLLSLTNYYNNLTSYSTVSLLPSLADLNASQVNGSWTVEGVPSSEGQNENVGYFGAWTLVIIYQDASDTLKNISVFDGYKEIANSDGYRTVTVPVSGFLTPLHGPVHSTLSLFAGEGDLGFTGDALFVDGINVPDGSLLHPPAQNTLQYYNDNYYNSNVDTEHYNAFNSMITGVPNRNPNLVNNFGIDIHNDSIGKDGSSAHPQIIGNGATDANITFTTNNDIYFPSMVAFTTELYQPRVCYYIDTIKDSNGTTVFSGGKFTAPIKPSDTYNINMWIANENAPNQTTPLETAQDVRAYLHTTNNFIYNGVQIKNIGSGLAYPSWDNNNSGQWNIGDGATQTQGGTITPFSQSQNNKVYIKLTGQFNQTSSDQNSSSLSKYFSLDVSLKTNSITISPSEAVPMSQCQNFNGGLNFYRPILGLFNVVNDNFSGTIDPTDSSDSKNALYTQIVNKPISVKVVSLANDKKTLTPYNGDVNVTIIQQPDNNNTDACENEAIGASDWHTVTFSDQDIKSLTNVTYPKALQKAVFAIKYSSNGKVNYVCSRDNFSIRPKNFDMVVPTSAYLKAGQEYNIAIDANGNNNHPSQGYTVAGQNLDINQTLYLKNNQESNQTYPMYGNVAFNDFNITNGQSSPSTQFTFNDVGKIGIKIIDKTWTSVDANSTNQHCGTNGIWICGDLNVTFIPYKFGFKTLSISNNDGPDTKFTYLSNLLEYMAGRIQTTIQALNKENNVTKNFSGFPLWENNVSITPSVKTSQYIYHDANTTQVNDQAIGFTNGEKIITYNDANSSTYLRFNFKRDINQAANPFDVNGSDINITINSYYPNNIDINGSRDMNADGNVTFLYGRVHSSSVQTSGSSIDVPLYYEAYCDHNCDTSILSQPTESVNWWKVIGYHPATDGNVSNVYQNSPTPYVTQNSLIDNANPAYVNLHYNSLTEGYPYQTTMDINASKWLIYNQFNPNAKVNTFSVRFNRGEGNWTGVEETNTSTDSNASTITTQRVLW